MHPAGMKNILLYTVDKSIDGLGLRVFNPLEAGQEIIDPRRIGSPKSQRYCRLV